MSNPWSRVKVDVRRQDVRPVGTTTRWSRRAKRRATDNPSVTLPAMPRRAQDRGWWAAAGILGLGLVLVLSSRRST